MSTRNQQLDLDLIAYADGRIDAKSARGLEIARYLQSDREARHLVRAYAAQDRLVRQEYDPVLSEPIPVQLLPHRIRTRNRRHRRQIWTRSILAAACAGLVVWIWTARVVTQPDPLEEFAELVAAETDVHRTNASPSMSPSSSHQPEVLPDFSSVGFALTGVRRIERGVLHLTEGRYQDAQGRRLRLFVGGELAGDAQSAGNALADRRDVVYWVQGGRFYALTGDLPNHVLGQFAAVTRPRSPADGGDPAATPAVTALQKSPPKPARTQASPSVVIAPSTEAVPAAFGSSKDGSM